MTKPISNIREHLTKFFATKAGEEILQPYNRGKAFVIAHAFKKVVS